MINGIVEVTFLFPSFFSPSSFHPPPTSQLIYNAIRKGILSRKTMKPTPTKNLCCIQAQRQKWVTTMKFLLDLYNHNALLSMTIQSLVGINSKLQTFQSNSLFIEMKLLKMVSKQVFCSINGEDIDAIVLATGYHSNVPF